MNMRDAEKVPGLSRQLERLVRWIYGFVGRGHRVEAKLEQLEWIETRLERIEPQLVHLQHQVKEVQSLGQRLDSDLVQGFARLDADVARLASLSPIVEQFEARLREVAAQMPRLTQGAAVAVAPSLAPSDRSPVAQVYQPLSADQRYLCITHSDRPASFEKCSLNYLEKRYEDLARLPPAQPFESLGPASEHSPYGGEVTIHAFERGTNGEQPQTTLVARLRPGAFKPQHATWHDGRLWVLGAEHLDVYDAELRPVRRIADPWLAGGHTVVPDGAGRMLVSCSASDAVLAVDAQTLAVTAAHRIPESHYGRNYPLTREHSVVEHYITNDLQIGHVNCASPWRGGILVSSLIPGAIGWFDPSGDYTELLRGFVGLHGVRIADDGLLHFCDSCNGMLVFAEPSEQGLAIRQRVKIASLWLHDAVQIEGSVYALAPFDLNRVLFMDVSTRSILGAIDCAPYGGAQFLAY